MIQSDCKVKVVGSAPKGTHFNKKNVTSKLTDFIQVKNISLNQPVYTNQLHFNGINQVEIAL